MTRPDLFVVGAPKCGSTALYTYLDNHPDVFMAAEKEVYYFCDDLFRLKPKRNAAEYLELFKNGAGARWVGEATPWYLYSRDAPRRIREFSPSARIVIALREPVSMMYSLHGERVYQGQEPITSFEEAILAERDGTRPPLPAKLDPPRGVEGYREIAHFAPFVKRYFDAFGRDAVHVIIFEELVNEPERTYRALCRFLDVREINLGGFGKVNPHKVTRSASLANVLRNPTDRLKWIIRHAMPRKLRSRTVDLLWRWNTARKPRPTLDPELRQQLAREMESANLELSTLIGHDLNCWAHK
ncbi:sulfotransferase [Gemmatimonadota bacterium]